MIDLRITNELVRRLIRRHAGRPALVLPERPAAPRTATSRVEVRDRAGRVRVTRTCSRPSRPPSAFSRRSRVDFTASPTA